MKQRSKTIRAGRRALWRAETADTPARKALGIMFRPRFAPLLFEFSRPATVMNSIHSFCCPEFDAVFLDSARRVTEILRVKPFRFVVPKKPAKYLVEVPAGQGRRAKPGQKLSW